MLAEDVLRLVEGEHAELDAATLVTAVHRIARAPDGRRVSAGPGFAALLAATLRRLTEAEAERPQGPANLGRAPAKPARAGAPTAAAARPQATPRASGFNGQEPANAMRCSGAGSSSGAPLRDAPAAAWAART